MSETVLTTFGPLSWLLALLTTIITSIYFITKKNKNLPPSPAIALPVIGHLYLMRRDPRNLFKQWANKFGSAFTLQMGPQTVIVLNTYEALKEAFVKQADYFSDRQSKSFMSLHSDFHTKGVAFSSGANWKEQRTTALAILRNFGMGKNILAEKISEEVLAFIKELSQRKGGPSDIKNIVNVSVSNVICSIIFGKRFEFDDPKFVSMMNIFNEIVKLISGVSVLNLFPALHYLPFDLFKGHKLLNLIAAMRQFNKVMIQERAAAYSPDNIDNFIVAYIDEIKKREALGQASYLDEENLASTIDNLFGAGTETTSTTIQWSLLYVLNNPETQKKIYNEILEQVGTERMPNMSDKPKLKYLTAFIMEVQRMASLVPFSLPHECSHETTIAGYIIPKDALILLNLDAVLRSEKIWGDPDTFRPERFLDAQGNVVSREELIPFSIGRRICLGEAMAKMELFLYLSSLFQRFEFLPADPKNIPPITYVFGIAVSPTPYDIRCVPRIF